MRQQIRLAGTMTKTVAWILGVNVGAYVLQHLFPAFGFYLALIPGRVFPYYLHTLLTYSILHGPLWHILFNMLALYFFGGDLDLFMGRRRFLTLYIGSALSGGIAAAIFLRDPIPVIGASGAVYGILTAYAVYFPRTEVLLMFVVPFKIRNLVLILIAISLFSSIFESGQGIAHLAHLGGAVFAFLYIYRAWRIREFVADLMHRWRRRRFKRIQ